MDEIRGLHYGTPSERGNPEYCQQDGQRMPCDMLGVIAALEASRAECARLRVALEASRISHDYVDEDEWYSCPKWPGFNGTCPRCANAEKPCECECYCGADSHNARIAAALNGAADATVGSEP